MLGECYHAMAPTLCETASPWRFQEYVTEGNARSNHASRRQAQGKDGTNGNHDQGQHAFRGQGGGSGAAAGKQEEANNSGPHAFGTFLLNLT